MTVRLTALACLALAAALLAGCASRSSVAIESVAGLYARQYDATIPGHLRQPEGDGPFPAVILMHGCSGLGRFTRAGLEAHADGLIAAGFATLILDSFAGRPGTGGEPGCSGEPLRAASVYRQWDAYHALRHLQQQPFVDAANVFLMGQSQGGGVALKAAADPAHAPIKRDWQQLYGAPPPRFRAAVAYYPWCGYVPKRIVMPLLVLSGALDDWTPPSGCVFEQGFVEGAPYRVIVYEGAHHSFDLPMSLRSYAGHTVGGHAAATVDSRQRMIAWFLTHLEPGG